MQNKKIYFIIGGCLVVYFVIMFIFLVVPQIKKDNEKAIIIFDTYPVSFLEYRDGSWKNSDDFSSYNWKNFDLYQRDKVNEDYLVQYYKDKWYYYTQEKKPVIINDLRFGIHTNFLVDFIDYRESTLNSNDIKIIKDIVSKKDIYNIGEFSSNQKIIMDFDSDGVDEELLVASNYYLTEESKKTFSILILKDGNDINILEEKYFSSSYERCTLFFDGVVHMKGQIHLIAGCTYFDRIGTKHCMYNVKNGKYERIVSC